VDKGEGLIVEKRVRTKAGKKRLKGGEKGRVKGEGQGGNRVRVKVGKRRWSSIGKIRGGQRVGKLGRVKFRKNGMVNDGK
jgi:hypothetical protein